MPPSAETQAPSSAILDKKIAARAAHELLAINAVQLNVNSPFTWVSGIKSPVYCDNRRINSFVKSRNAITDAFVQLIGENFDAVDLIAGVATGGIPIAMLIADRLKLPFVYVRQEPKKHGLMRQIEGEYTEGARVILIEDHVSTGGSSMNAVDGLKNGNLQVLALISIMTYNFPQSISLFNEKDVTYHSLTDLDTVLDQALLEGKLTEEEVESVLRFRNDPKKWENTLS